MAREMVWRTVAAAGENQRSLTRLVSQVDSSKVSDERRVEQDDMKREVGVIDSIRERIQAEGFDALTESERYYWAIWWLEGEANNGGFDQFFRNSSGELTEDALRGLTAVGAHRMAGIFQAAVDLFPNGQVPKNHQQGERIHDVFTPSQQARLD